MQRPNPETVTLNDILITEELSRRTPRSPNWQAEAEAMRSLGRQMAQASENLMQTLADTALELCQAGTAGVSLLETTPDGTETFRWNALAGTLVHHVGGSTPRNFSPCGVCFDQGSPILFSHPERYFTYFQSANTPIVEGLVLPLIADSHVLGTIWIMSHDEGRQFDSEDGRVMTSLADFTATALLLKQRQTGELLATNATLETEIVERKQAEERTQALISNLPGGAVFVVDCDLRYLLAEGEALAIAGFKPEDFVGRTIFEVLPPELAASYEPMYRKALAGKPFEDEHHAYNHWYISRGTPLRAETGEIDAVLVVSYDISDRKRAEEALRGSEEKYRSLFTSIDEGFNLLEMIPDESNHPADFRIVETNPAWEQQTGLTNATGKTLLEIAPNFEQQLLDFYSEVVISGRGRRTEYYTASTDRWYTVYASRIGGEGSRQVAVVFNDITNRKRTEEQQAFLLKFSDALRAEPDAGSVASQAVRMLAEHLRLDRFWLSEVFEQQDISTVGPEYHRPDLPPVSGVYRLSDYPETMRQLATQPMVIHDVANDSGFSDSEKAMLSELHLRALLVVSLRRGQHQVIWALAAAMTTPRHWNESERVLLEQVGERAWAAVERARAEAALRELEIQRVREQSAREQERQRAESLAQLDRAKTAFFSNVSHEFRTPLTLLLAPLQDALSDSVNPLAQEQLQRLELAHRNANRLLKLVNTLLDFSRIEAGRMEAVYEPTDLALLTMELASVFRSAIERAGLRLIVDCPALPESVYVDRQMWEKIVLNLLSNAFKFTLEGEITVRQYPADSDRLQLQIQDTGTGIAPEELSHLFERFYQIRGAKARTHEGSGIGLALVQELIKMHGGTVEVSSTVGQGTCFTVTIPLGTAHLPSDRLRLDVGDRIATPRTLASTAIGAAPYVEEVERWLPAEGGSVEFSVLNSELEANSLTQNSKFFTRNSYVLLVDDNADMRDYLTRILSEYGQVEAVADGAAALAAARAQVPDLVLTDVMMPGLDGFELLRALRADPNTREVPIILLSARAGEESVVSGLEAGADDYLIKPFSAQELVSRVNAHLQKAQLRGEALRQERTTSRRKDELLSTVSHELNTPLVAILGWTRLLRSSPTNQSMLMKSLDTIERNATLQAKLIQDLLDMSRITAGKLHLSQEPVELKSVIENAIAAVKTAAIAKDIHLQWKPTVREPHVVVLGDGDRLGQVICNLLNNAIKFTPQGGTVEISLTRVESREQGQRSREEFATHHDAANVGEDASPPAASPLTTHHSYAQIRVMDTGIGIAAEFLPHVFDRFRQAESPDSAKGLGLGLAIARHLVELHNGTIHAESLGAGQGATFTVRLPIFQKL